MHAHTGGVGGSAGGVFCGGLAALMVWGCGAPLSYLITILGVVLGGVAGYFGGWVDSLIMRLSDVLMCLPGVPILLIISTILDASDIDAKYRIYLLMIYLTFISWTGTARLVRGEILRVREMEYVQAAISLGANDARIIFSHIIPNVMAPIIVEATMQMARAILTEASLSYLGCGVQLPTASWGNMLNEANNLATLTGRPWQWLPAGACIFLAVLSINFIGDGLRDAFDPKLKQ